jgi:hypothetical protein
MRLHRSAKCTPAGPLPRANRLTGKDWSAPADADPVRGATKSRRGLLSRVSDGRDQAMALTSIDASRRSTTANQTSVATLANASTTPRSTPVKVRGTAQPQPMLMP